MELADLSRQERVICDLVWPADPETNKPQLPPEGFIEELRRHTELWHKLGRPGRLPDEVVLILAGKYPAPAKPAAPEPKKESKSAA